MKIDYVVISSDDNPMYKEFYPIVSEKWNRLGFKTYYINITNEDSIEENEYGVVHKIKSLDNVPTSFQSQVVRLFSSNLIDARLLISDIDMLPLNGNYFSQNSFYLKDDNIVIYTTSPYHDRPHHAMCYILSNSNTLSEMLGIKNLSYSEFINDVIKLCGTSWFADETYFYEKTINNKENLFYLNRNIHRTRIDRSNWVYDINLLHNKTYVDSHLLRPYSQYKKQIDKLLLLSNS